MDRVFEVLELRFDSGWVLSSDSSRVIGRRIWTVGTWATTTDMWDTSLIISEARATFTQQPLDAIRLGEVRPIKNFYDTETGERLVFDLYSVHFWTQRLAQLPGHDDTPTQAPLAMAANKASRIGEE